VIIVTEVKFLYKKTYDFNQFFIVLFL